MSGVEETTRYSYNESTDEKSGRAISIRSPLEVFIINSPTPLFSPPHLSSKEIIKSLIVYVCQLDPAKAMAGRATVPLPSAAISVGWH
jgi:hypothetical protein